MEKKNGGGTLLSPPLTFQQHEETTGVSFLLMQEAMKRHEKLGLNPDEELGWKDE